MNGDCGSTARDASALLADRAQAVPRALGAVALALAVSGSLYTLSDVRLGFIDVAGRWEATLVRP